VGRTIFVGKMKLSEDDIARARAVALVPLMARDVVLIRKGNGLWGLCPFHAERSASLHVQEGKGFYCFGCGARGKDGIAWLQYLKGLRFEDAVRELIGEAPRSERRTVATPYIRAKAADDETRRRLAARIWREAHPLRLSDPSAALLYLWSRGLLLKGSDPPACLRYHPALWCGEAKQKLPALICAIEEDAGLTAVQRIWLSARLEITGENDPPDSRAGVEARKTTLGPMAAGAVRLARPGASLGLAEGVETALAAMALFKMPVWATCGVQRFATVATPPDTELWIYADRGSERLVEAAREAIRQRTGRRPLLLYPELKDWNDELKRSGP
jgi:hypothetical protein